MSSHITVPAVDFVRGINSVIACVSRDCDVPALNVVHIEWDERTIVFVATDRYVMGEQTIKRPVPAAGEQRSAGAAPIPLETVKSVLAVLKATAPKGNLVDCRGVMLVAVDDYGRGKVHGQAFESPGEFPKYRSLFPKENAYTEVGRVLFDPDKLAQLAGPKVRGLHVPLDCRFTGDAKPVAVTRVDDETFRGLLMPIRPPSCH